MVLVHAVREREGPREFSDTALAGPVAVLADRLVILGSLVGSLDGLFGVGLVLGRLRGVVVFALGPALHDQGLWVGELNVDVFSSNSGQLTVQVEG